MAWNTKINYTDKAAKQNKQKKTTDLLYSVGILNTEKTPLQLFWGVYFLFHW